jgi:hypothetical protein
MTRGVLMFAFNNGVTDYFEMAVRTATRVKHFLQLPVTVVTDSNTILENYSNPFDFVITEKSDITNIKDKVLWINKGRHKAFELSPYDETIVLDTDYLINSDSLLKPFELYDDFMCHNSTSFVMIDNQVEKVSNKFIDTAWATVIYFKKTNRVKQIFECMEMIQNNYQHYITVFDIPNTMYRNDYSLTIALWIVNGHTTNKQDYIPWNLLHLNRQVKAYRVNDTEYVFLDNKQKYIRLKDIDFHLLDKENFMELTNE